MKNQADDGTAKDKIREDGCNRGEGDIVEIAKRWSLRRSNEALCDTGIEQETKLPPGEGENRWKQI